MIEFQNTAPQASAVVPFAPSEASYSRRDAAVRAARKVLGAQARPGDDFNIWHIKATGWKWSAVEASAGADEEIEDDLEWMNNFAAEWEMSYATAWAGDRAAPASVEPIERPADVDTFELDPVTGDDEPVVDAREAAIDQVQQEAAADLAALRDRKSVDLSIPAFLKREAKDEAEATKVAVPARKWVDPKPRTERTAKSTKAARETFEFGDVTFKGKNAGIMMLLARDGGATTGELLDFTGWNVCRATPGKLAKLAGHKMVGDDGKGRDRRFRLVPR